MAQMTFKLASLDPAILDELTRMPVEAFDVLARIRILGYRILDEEITLMGDVTDLTPRGRIDGIPAPG